MQKTPAKNRPVPRVGGADTRCANPGADRGIDPGIGAKENGSSSDAKLKSSCHRRERRPRLLRPSTRSPIVQIEDVGGPSQVAAYVCQATTSERYGRCHLRRFDLKLFGPILDLWWVGGVEKHSRERFLGHGSVLKQVSGPITDKQKAGSSPQRRWVPRNFQKWQGLSSITGRGSIL
jgi:hypothetical protein